MTEDGYSDRISAELVGYNSVNLSWMQSRSDLVVHCGQRKLQPSESVVLLNHDHAAAAAVSHDVIIGIESVPMQLTECRFPRLAIFNAKILIYFSNKL